MPAMLSVEDVLHIHYRVCRDFADSADPVGIEGIREDGLLESAVFRQHVGYDGTLKYTDPYENAATLTFGICCGHPFNNGNKRTALVAMLAHLDANGHAVFGINQTDLYRMIKAVATHDLGRRIPVRRKRRKEHDYSAREADIEVREIAKWLGKRARKIQRGEQSVTYRQLKQLLANHGYNLRKTKSNSIGIFRKVTVRGPLLKKRDDWKHVGSMSWPGEGRVVPIRELKTVRRICKLDEPNGCDTEAFYGDADKIEPFINEYRSVLARLSKE